MTMGLEPATPQLGKVLCYQRRYIPISFPGNDPG
jgi:hypothetical protein